MEEKLLMIFIDAYSSRYINKKYSPSIFKLFEEGYCKKIEPLMAFEGLGSTIFSGTWPVKNKVWTSFVKKSNQKIDNDFLHKLFKISDLIVNDRISWDCRYIMYRIFKRAIPTPNLIPSSLLKFFELKMGSIFHENVLKEIPTIFDTVKNSGKTIKFISQSPFDTDEKIANLTIEYLKKKEFADLTYLKFGSLDPLGHKYGPESMRTLERVSFIDNALNNIINHASKVGMNVMVFSDHGMSPVYNHINLVNLLKMCNLKLGEDYIYFLDSTLARFWFKDKYGYNLIRESLSKLDCGFIVTEDDLKREKLPRDTDAYGELIFAFKEGNIICPDFFHKNTQLKGMHTYFNTEYDTPIFILCPFKSQIKRNSLKFVDIMPTALDILNIDIPETCDGKSAYKQIN